MHILLYKTVKFYILNLFPPKYTLENQKIWSFFSVFDDVITYSRDIGGSFLVCQKMLMMFQVWAKFHFIWLSISGFNQEEQFLPPPPPLNLTSIKNPIQNSVKRNYLPDNIITTVFVFLNKPFLTQRSVSSILCQV